MDRRSEFLIGATKSGSGKTLLTLGILAALARRGLIVQPFKCGPDFIDPTHHRVVVGRTSYNLDIHMMGEVGCIDSYKRYSAGSEAVLVEGVMGLFDGGNSSSASLAKQLDIPVLLVIDVRSAAESVAAVIKGFESFDQDVRICGVICNRIGSEKHRRMIEDAVQEHCNTEVLGFFPRDVDFEMESRHLGLHMGYEAGFDREKLDKLANLVEQSIDMDRLLDLSAKSVVRSDGDSEEYLGSTDELPRLRLAVAQDEAFCFYYEENFHILESCGFELVPFSPLNDRCLPENIQGVYLGGGYPELYAAQLVKNNEMRKSISQWAENGEFIYGECGGFMYMTETLTDGDGQSFPMCSIFPVQVKMKNRLSRLGYRKATLIGDVPFGDEEGTVYGHEFHYSEIVERADSLEFLYLLENGKKEGCRKNNAFGSYVHLHFAKSRDNLQKLHRKLLARKEVTIQQHSI